MPTVPIRDANDNVHYIELPLAPGRASSLASRPVVMCDEDYNMVRPPFLGPSVDVAFTDVSAQSVAITGSRVRLIARGADCRVAASLDPTATASDTLLIAGHEYRFSITSGYKIAAIRDAAVSGVLNVTVML